MVGGQLRGAKGASKCTQPLTCVCVLAQVGAGEGGRYRVVLDSDEERFGGRGRLGHGVDHFTQPEGVPGNLLLYTCEIVNDMNNPDLCGLTGASAPASTTSRSRKACQVLGCQIPLLCLGHWSSCSAAAVHSSSQTAAAIQAAAQLVMSLACCADVVLEIV